MPKDFTPEDIERFVAEHDKQVKYGTPAEMVKSTARGVLSGIGGPLPALAERALGTPAETLRDSAEGNPGLHLAGQVAGLGISTLGSVGLAPLLEGGAAEVAGKLGLDAITTESPLIAKVGSAAVKSAVEGAMFSTSDELTKFIAEDPHQTMSTAAINVGLGGLIGGGVGAGISTVPPLWKAANESKVGQILNAIAGKGGGIEGQVPDAVLHAIDKLGIEAAPEVRAALSNDPVLVQMAKTLEQTDTSSSGLAYQKTLKSFKAQINERVQQAMEPFGNKLPELSNAEAGKKIGTTLSDEIKARVSPLSEDFNRIKANFEHVPIQSATGKLADDIASLAMKEGWMVSPSSDIAKQVSTILEEIPNLRSLKDLSHYIESVGNATSKDPLNGALKRAGGMLKDTLRQTESNIIEREFANIAPEMVTEFRAAQKAYAQESRLKDAIDDRLHLRGSTSGYAQRVKDMAVTDSETLLRRLSGKGDADLLQFLQANYPKTAEQLQKYHVDAILDKAASKAKPGETFNASAVIKEMRNMQPELRDFAIPKSVQDKVESAAAIMEKFAETPHNHSNTARTLDKLLEYLPSSAVGLATMALGHNPATALLFGTLAKTLGKDAPDAMKLSMLKFLATKGEVSPSGFKSMFEFMRHAIKGEASLTKAASAVMREGAEVIPISLAPKADARQSLEKALETAQADPTHLIDKGSLLGQYMPEEGSALGMLGAKASQYLLSMKPTETQSGPLTPPSPVNPVAQAKYERALDIAQQPLLVLESIQQGSLTSDDVKTLVNVYPALYKRFETKLMDSMTELMAKGEEVPYAVRQGLSVFAQMPLDASFKGPSILAAQPPPPQPPGGPQAAKGAPQKLNKLDQLAYTPNQAAQARQSGSQT